MREKLIELRIDEVEEGIKISNGSGNRDGRSSR